MCIRDSYGSLIYGLAPPSHRLHDAVQNASVRFAQGRFALAPHSICAPKPAFRHYIITGYIWLLVASRQQLLPKTSFNISSSTLYVNDLFIVRYSHKFVPFSTTVPLKTSAPSTAFPLSTLLSHHGLCHRPALILNNANFSASLPTLPLFTPTSSKMPLQALPFANRFGFAYSIDDRTFSHRPATLPKFQQLNFKFFTDVHKISM